MGNGEQGRLLIYTHVQGWFPDSVPPADLIELSASLQRRFPGQLVEPADLEWLRQAVGESLPLPPRSRPLPPKEELELEPLDLQSPPKVHDLLREPLELPELSLRLPEMYQYVYLVLGWLGGAVSKQVADQAIKAAADMIRDWMRSRRSKTRDTTQVAYILGPDGEVLKKVQVRTKAPAQRRTTRRRR